MTSGLNTARALLNAGNFEGARRIANEALKKNPDNLEALRILVEIAEHEETYDRALDLISTGLEKDPRNLFFRKTELKLYILLKKKRRSRLGIIQFKADFPGAKSDQDFLDIIYESKFGSDKRATQRLQNSVYAQDTYAQGIFKNNSGALLAAQKHFRQALKNDPTNPEILKTYASNQYLLCRMLSARKLAHRAIQMEPGNFEMKLLSKMAVCVFYPPIYYLHILITLMLLALRWIPEAVTWVLFIFVILYLETLLSPIGWFHAQIETLLGFPYFGWISSVVIVLFFLTYTLFIPKVRNFVFRSRKNVRLKNY